MPTFLSTLKSFGICYHTKINFQKLFIPLQSLFIITDRVYLALLTASTVIGVMTGGHLIRWPKYLTALTKLEIRSDRVNSNSILVHTSTCFYFYQLTSSVNSAWNHLIVMAAPPNNNDKKEKGNIIMERFGPKRLNCTSPIQEKKNPVLAFF